MKVQGVHMDTDADTPHTDTQTHTQTHTHTRINLCKTENEKVKKTLKCVEGRHSNHCTQSNDCHRVMSMKSYR